MMADSFPFLPDYFPQQAVTLIRSCEKSSLGFFSFPCLELENLGFLFLLRIACSAMQCFWLRMSQSFLRKLIAGNWEMDVYLLFFACCPKHLLLATTDILYQVKWSVDLTQYGYFSVPLQINNYFLGHKEIRHWCKDTYIR